MADLEAVLADVSYLMAMEKSKSTPAARTSKKITLPDPSVRSVMHKYLEKNNEVSFEKIFYQKLGYLLFKEYCETLHPQPVPQLYFYEEIKKFERLETELERERKAREIYDNYIMGEELGRTETYPAEAVQAVWKHLKRKEVPTSLFQPYMKTIFEILQHVYNDFLSSAKYTRFCQWKNLELNIQLTMNDFSFHRIIGRGGFGEVYGCRKADTGKMYAMKCLDKKRIKLKQGEILALNERIMLSLVSTGDDCPFIVNMTYAFQTPEKLYFVLDLMNGGDLHYHLSQHGKFSESEMRFYAAEVILGLEHMHSRHVVYRDLKPANILLDENGHIRISDLGLACDFSKKKPQASVGTHGYMAPEVLCKNQSYDSSADWFSLGCMLYKLLKGHSPFRQHKTRDKHEIDRMTLTMIIEMPDSFSIELRSLLTGLLQRDVNKRLGCRGKGANELKSHPFFRGIDWRVVYLQKLSPPLIPARGEVNAADAFDIGSFDDEDTKHIKLTDADQELYRNFPVVVSERWQHEISETIFDYINHEADKAEMKRKSKLGKGAAMLGFHEDETQSDCILHGYIKRLGGTFTATWLTRYVRLYPNRLELYSDSANKLPELIFMDQIEEICNDYVQIKNEQCIVIKLFNHSKYVFTNSDEIGLKEWHVSLKSAYKESLDMLTTMAEKATKIYGTEIPLKQIGKRRQQLQNEAAAMNLGGNASASFEQKIIQRAIQASADQTKQQQQQQQQQQSVATSSAIPQPTINSVPTQATNTSGLPACQLLHRNKSQSGAHTHHHSHKHHRRPQHSLHRHKETKECDRDKQSATTQHGVGVGSSRHYHHHHRRKLKTSASSDAHFDPSKSKRDHRVTKEKIEGCTAGISGQDIDVEKRRQHSDACVDTKKETNEIAADTCDDNGGDNETSTMKTSHDNVEDKDKQNNEQTTTTTTTTKDDELNNIKKHEHNINIKEEEKTQLNDNESEKSLLVKQNLNKFDNKTNKSVEPTNKQQQQQQQLEAISSSQSSCSDTSSSSGNQGEDDDNEEDDEDRNENENENENDNDNEEDVRCKATIEGSSNDNLNSKLSDNKTSTKDVGDAETLDTTSANFDHQNKQQSLENNEDKDEDEDEDEDNEMKQTNLSGGEELTIIKPTLSLESVSEVVEVLNDPSKRITSDNRERERDLVLQYEKLHISNRTSSSSVED